MPLSSIKLGSVGTHVFKRYGGQTLIEFALAVPVLVAVFTIIFTLGYATYKAHQASTSARALDQNSEVLANKQDASGVLAEAFSSFDGYRINGPITGFAVVSGLYTIPLKWIPGLPSIKVVGYTVMPHAALLPNEASGTTPTLSSNVSINTDILGSGQVSRNSGPSNDFCEYENDAFPENGCITLPFDDPDFPTLYGFGDNCNTDLGAFIATETVNGEDHDIIPVDCYSAVDADKSTCRTHKLKHAARFLTQFVLVADDFGGCAIGTNTLFLPYGQFPTFNTPGDY
ncbi:MAG: TadE family protein [Vampirovibrionales bacterium]